MDGKVLTREELNAMGEDYFKLNLPDTFENYQSGNGEGIWAVCNPKDRLALRADMKKGQFIAFACNDSFYYPGKIVIGSPILAEHRGENRPVACWDDLDDTKEAAVNKMELLKKIGISEEEEE